MMRRSCPLVIVALAARIAAVGHAQVRQPVAELVPMVETDGVHAGAIVRLALQVRLPDGLHVQSNTPRDPSLIATVLTLEPPPGITVAEIVYPPARDLAQSGQGQPLAVFGHEFVIGLRVAVERGLSAHEVVLPARLRYQACDAVTCYIPARGQTEWPLRIVPDTVATPAGHAEVFGRIAFEKK
jgi:DsbC/DsbD-like thiol-disulfide interchange protein